MANQTVYPYGTGGTLPSSIGVINDLITGGADKALSAEQGKIIGDKWDNMFQVVFFENSSTADWKSGNIENGTIKTTYQNKYLIIKDFPAGVTEFIIERGTPPDSTYYLSVYGSSDGTSWTVLNGFGTSSGENTYQLGNYTRLLFLVWDQPSDSRVKEESITVKYEMQSILTEDDIANNVVGTNGKMAGIELVRKIAKDLWKQTLTSNTDEFYWQQGGINGSTGAEEANAKAIRSNYIQVQKEGYTYINPNPISGENFLVVVYNSDKSKAGDNIGSTFGDLSEAIESRLTSDYGYIRLVYYGNTNITPQNENALKSKIILGLSRNSTEDQIKTYENPVIRVDNPDPTVWNGEDGYFYLYATGNLSSKRMYRSANLYSWEATGDAPFDDVEAQKIATAFGASSLSQGFWAPHVIKINSTTWNLYIGKPQGGIAILTSNNPIKNFKFIKFIAKPSSGAGEFIDAEVGIDVDGKVWLFTGGSQSIFRRQMTDDGLDWAENSSFERCAGVTSSTYRESTFEGPYLYRRGGYWYLFCSSGQYSQGNYKLRVVRSSSLGGTFVDKSGNESTDGYAETVLVSNGTVLTGPGHNAPIFVDANNDTWILYHSHWSGFETSSHRGVCLDQIKWDQDGWPYIEDGTPSVIHEIPSYFR